jgi:hypothetical protein
MAGTLAFIFRLLETGAILETPRSGKFAKLAVITKELAHKVKDDSHSDEQEHSTFCPPGDLSEYTIAQQPLYGLSSVGAPPTIEVTPPTIEVRPPKEEIQPSGCARVDRHGVKDELDGVEFERTEDEAVIA